VALSGNERRPEGTDANATSARQLTGVDRLYTYVGITPGGEIGESGKVGSPVSGFNPKHYRAIRDEAWEQFVAPVRPLLDPVTRTARASPPY
jgi:hypothetical protein